MEEDRRQGLPLLLIAAALLFFAGLGSTALWGSEDRWAEIARMMVSNKDFFHPCINGEIYFDKPLLSYWLIAFPALLLGSVSEFMVRLPSALAALGGMLAVYWLASRMRDRATGLLAAWLLLTAMGFIFWARKGAADLENLSAIIIAVSWYYYCRDRAGFWSYLLFGMICVVGAHTKGLPAIGVPVLVVLPDVLRNGNWKKHLKWQLFAAAAVCILVYLLPFVLAAAAPLPAGWQVPTTFDALRMPAWAEPYRRELCGLYLVWKENVMRFFTPFDHQEPFYSYFIHVPRILLPWTLLFVAALVWMVKNYRKLDHNSRWMLEAAVLVFLLFSASGSRRWYYILPILPFCAVIMAFYLNGAAKEKLTDWLFRFHQAVVVIAGITLTLTIPLYFGWRGLLSFAAHRSGKSMQKLAMLQDFSISPIWLIALTAVGIVALLPWMITRRHRECLDGVLPNEALRRWSPLVLAVAVLTFGLYVVCPPLLEPYRTEKTFAVAISSYLKQNRSELGELAFYQKSPPEITYYMQTAAPVAVVRKDDGNNSADDEETTPNGSAQQIKLSALATNAKIKYLIIQNRSLSEVQAALPGRVLQPVVQEKVWPWEKNKKKMSLYTIKQK